MPKDCGICGTELKKDLFAVVTGEPCCSLCTTTHMGWLPMTPERIAGVRRRLGLADGEYLEVDRGAEACRILGR